ncbi:MAG: hypothetical protein NTY19_06865 [Planctomycetota bacterium]|nr:hypothetical protein [Planctomycetota bacterium]
MRFYQYFACKMGVIQQVRYALADLRRRPWTVLLNALAISVSVVCLLVSAFYGWAVFRYQKSIVDESLPTLIVVDCPEVTDERLRFDENRIRGIASMPNVAMAFPKVELQVKVSLSGQCKLMVPMEGTLPDDPAMPARQLGWGCGVSGKDTREVLMSQRLFQKLGGTVGHSAVTPADALIEVSRTVDGQEQTSNV